MAVVVSWEAKQEGLADQLNQLTPGTEEETPKNTEATPTKKNEPEKERMFFLDAEEPEVANSEGAVKDVEVIGDKLMQKASEEGVSDDLKQMMKAMMDKLDVVVANQQSAASSSSSQPPKPPEPAHAPPDTPGPSGEPHPPPGPPEDAVMCLGLLQWQNEVCRTQVCVCVCFICVACLTCASCLDRLSQVGDTQGL